MSSIRFVAAGTVSLIFLGMAAGGTAAHTTTDETPGKPMQLLKIVEQPNQTKTKLHAKRVAAKKHKTHWAGGEGKRPRWPTHAAAAPAPATVAPAASSAAPTDVAAAEPVPPPAPAFAEPTPGELVVGDHTLRVASPDGGNESDLAANDANTQAGAAATNSATASAPAASDVAEPTTTTESMNAAPARASASEVGSASWIAQVLAALGGAVAAGSVAWFLIGSTPQRTYG